MTKRLSTENFYPPSLPILFHLKLQHIQSHLCIAILYYNMNAREANLQTNYCPIEENTHHSYRQKKRNTNNQYTNFPLKGGFEKGENKGKTCIFKTFCINSRRVFKNSTSN